MQGHERLNAMFAPKRSGEQSRNIPAAFEQAEKIQRSLVEEDGVGQSANRFVRENSKPRRAIDDLYR
jgi:hypothetical protein